MADIDDIDDDASQQADGLTEQSQAAAGEGADDSGRDAQGDGAAAEGSDGQGGGDDEGGVVITIGEEQPPQELPERAPDWLRNLRKSDREKTRRIRELEQQLAQGKPADDADILGPKPTLVSCDYDESELETQLEAWKEKEFQVKAKALAKKEEERRAQEAWDQRMQEYERRKMALKVSDFEDAEAVVFDTLTPVQRGILIKAAKQPEAMTYALGTAPSVLKKLAGISDPIDFTCAVRDMEQTMKVSSRKVAPAPERKVQGQAPVTGSIESQLAALEAEAQKTGDRSKVAAFRRQQRRAQA